jgi:hypothetical protein
LLQAKIPEKKGSSGAKTPPTWVILTGSERARATGVTGKVNLPDPEACCSAAAARRPAASTRLILIEARGRSGYYFYFLCRGRQEGECGLPYLRVEPVEDAVEREYARLALPGDFAGQFEAGDGIHRRRAAVHPAAPPQSQRRNGALAGPKNRLIDLAAEGTLPVGKVRSRLTSLQQEQERIRRQLETVNHDLAEGASALTAALRLLDKPQQLFQAAGETTRRLLTQTFFERLFIDDDDVTAVRYQEPSGICTTGPVLAVRLDAHRSPEGAPKRREPRHHRCRGSPGYLARPARLSVFGRRFE